jgi:hypothetical protein
MDQWDKVAMPGKLLADLMGWLEKVPEDQHVLGNLTQAEIDVLKNKISEARKAESDAIIASSEPEKPN